MSAALDHRLCVAPMMDVTDRHCRYFLRRLTRRTVLYTEMLTVQALLHGDTERLLAFHPEERPLAVQLGGSDPKALAKVAAIAERWGYDEVNLNVGCPSPRVSSGRFGACLMAEPALVAECVSAMRAATSLPVTVKTRIGIDDRDSYAHLHEFTGTLVEAGLGTLIVHARKAWLQGLSPRQNRELPPLEHARVHRLKRDFPNLEVVLNGGLTSLEQARSHLDHVDGAMLGREACRNPHVLADADRRLFFATAAPVTRHAAVRAMFPYIEQELGAGTRLSHITRHLLGLFQGQPGAKAWRRTLSEHAHRPGAGLEVVEHALSKVHDAGVAATAAA